MYAIVGLGNPDSRYALTPHNVGFMVCDLLSFSFNFSFDFSNKFIGEIGNFNYDSHKILVLKPHTYMNLSGKSVGMLVNFYKIEIDNIIVIHDDIDLYMGVIRIKKGSSSGGHKGVQSVIDALGSNNFIRIKIGVGKDENREASEYVLSSLEKESLKIINSSIEKAKNAAVDIISTGLTQAMNVYNAKNNNPSG